MQELASIKSDIQSLQNALKPHEEEENEGQHHDEEHGAASETEVETLKLLQAQHRKILSIEQRLAQNGTSKAVDPQVVQNQIVEAAKKELVEHQDVEPGYVTSAQLIQVTAAEKPDDWVVTIKFKKTRADSEVWLATLRCHNKDAEVTCEPAQLETSPR